jgi:hypothetical protein
MAGDISISPCTDAPAPTDTVTTITSFWAGCVPTPPVSDVRLTLKSTLLLLVVPVTPPTYLTSPYACEPDGELDGELDGLAEGLLLGEADGESLGEAEGEAELETAADGEELGEADGEDEGMTSLVITCAARTKLAFSKMSNSSIFKAAPSIRVFSSRIMPP